MKVAGELLAVNTEVMIAYYSISSLDQSLLLFAFIIPICHNCSKSTAVQVILNNEVDTIKDKFQNIASEI